MRGGGNLCERAFSFLEGRSSFDFYSFFGGELHTSVCFLCRSAFLNYNLIISFGSVKFLNCE